MGVDPCEARALMVQNDGDTCQLKVLSGWRVVCGEVGGEPMTCAQALRELEDDFESGVSYLSELREIFLSWSRDGNLPSARVVGNHLNKFRGRVVDGRMLQFHRGASSREWYVKLVSTSSTSSASSRQPDREEELTDAEKKEFADVLAELKGYRDQDLRSPCGWRRTAIQRTSVTSPAETKPPAGRQRGRKGHERPTMTSNAHCRLARVVPRPVLPEGLRSLGMN
jgi:hypothetical protein